MYYFALLVIGYLLVLFQQSVFSFLTDGRFVPEISLVLIVFLGVYLNVVMGCILSMVIGFFMDCLYGTLTGFYMFIYAFVFSLCRVIAPQVYLEKREAIIIITLLCGLGETVIYVILCGWVYNMEISGGIIGLYLLQMILVSILSPLLFGFLRYSQQKYRA